jgi:hypothetical protein
VLKKKTAAKLKKAASSAAALNVSTLVLTMVEIELAESLIPFPKLKMRARIMPMMTN